MAEVRVSVEEGYRCFRYLGVFIEFDFKVFSDFSFFLFKMGSSIVFEFNFILGFFLVVVGFIGVGVLLF